MPAPHWHSKSQTRAERESYIIAYSKVPHSHTALALKRQKRAERKSKAIQRICEVIPQMVR